jgi:hypothetical protein
VVKTEALNVGKVGATIVPEAEWTHHPPLTPHSYGR